MCTKNILTMPAEVSQTGVQQGVEELQVLMHAGDKVWTDSGRDALAAYAMGSYF